MATPTRTISGLVLRRTKLGESDVIVTLLAEDGSQYRAVAKGARKPTSSFASRLELYSVADILLAQGKNLDIVKEVRLIKGNVELRSDYIRASVAAPIVELLAKATFQDQPTPRLFSLSTATLSLLATTEGDPLIITLAGLIKTLAFLGFRPIFQECIDCGSPLALKQGSSQAFSYFDGGSVCEHCSHTHETTLLNAEMLQWCNTLLYSTLDEVKDFQIPAPIIQSAFVFMREWIHLHLGITMKSISFLFKNILVHPDNDDTLR